MTASLLDFPVCRDLDASDEYQSVILQNFLSLCLPDTFSCLDWGYAFLARLPEKGHPVLPCILSRSHGVSVALLGLLGFKVVLACRVSPRYSYWFFLGCK